MQLQRVVYVLQSFEASIVAVATKMEKNEFRAVAAAGQFSNPTLQSAPSNCLYCFNFPGIANFISIFLRVCTRIFAVRII